MSVHNPSKLLSTMLRKLMVHVHVRLGYWEYALILRVFIHMWLDPRHCRQVI